MWALCVLVMSSAALLHLAYEAVRCAGLMQASPTRVQER